MENEEDKKRVYSLEEINAFVEDETLRLPISLKLEKPFEFGSESLEYITITREPLAGDIGSLPVSGQLVGDMYGVLAKITNWPLPKIKKLRMKDYKNLSSILKYFLDDSDDDGE